MNTRSSSSKRVVIINNLNSANIEQAIFILKGSEQVGEINHRLISEAQKIIDNYVKRLENPNHEYLYKLEQKQAPLKPKKKIANKIARLIIAGISAAALIAAIYCANSLIAMV